MAPEWWFDMMEQAEANHEPELHEGRDWQELNPDEQEANINDIFTDLADMTE